MDIIYKVNGSDLTRDKNVSYSPQIGWKILLDDIQFTVQTITVDLSSMDQVLYIELAAKNLKK